MLWGGVAACYRYGTRTVRCVGRRTQYSEQHTHHTYDMLPHHHITYNDVVFFTEF